MSTQPNPDVLTEMEVSTFLAQSQKRVNQAKIVLFTKPKTTFFSVVLANLKLRFSEDLPTAGTDGIWLFINPWFIKDLKTNELIGLLLHEVMHVVYQHMDRQITHKLDKQRWNIAGDYLINGELDNLGFELPKMGLLNHQYDGLSTKQIYDLLENDMPTPNEDWLDIIFDGDTLPNEGEDSGLDGSSGSRSSGFDKSEEIKTILVKAAIQAKLNNDWGSIPGHIQRQVEKLVNPKLPWNVIFQNRLQSHNKDDFTWKKPNRRFWPEYYLPGRYSEALDSVFVSIDVSGSITQDQFDSFMSEISYLWDIMKPTRLRITTFDTRISFDRVYEQGDCLDPIKIHGGGGTCIHDTVEILREESPDLAVIFTDGQFSMPYMKDITTDVIWIIYGGVEFKAPTGEVIVCEDE